MAKRDMFAEAIAEAKLVKETAIENAKAALTESFAPHLQSMISAKLQEMEQEDEEDIEESFDMPESNTEETIDEIDNEVDELDELLKEIEGENDLDEVKEDDDKVEDDDIKDDETETDEETEDELNIEDMSEEDLKSFIEDVINDMIESGELEPGDEEIEDEENEEEEEIDLNNLEDDEEIEDEEVDVDEVLEDDMVSNEELEEAYNTINTLRQEINEIKLLNAKLLYSNKIFKVKNLTEGKKLQVLHAFDKVTTVKEAKTTYEILKENLNDKKVIKESFKGSSASKSITPIKESKQPIVEVNDQYKRWQVLAYYPHQRI